MDATTAVVIFSALVSGVASFFAPMLIGRIPEPAPESGEGAGETGGPDTVAQPVDGSTTPPPKMLYVDVAARRGLGLRTALLGALGGALLGWALGWSWSLLVVLPLVPILVALSVVDWHTRLLPTWVIRPTYYLTMVTLLVVAVVTGVYGDLGRAALAWLATGAFFFLLWFVNSAGLGYGDVRLSGILGMALGHLGWAEVLTGIWSAFLVGGVGGGVLALAGIVDRKGVPFGPFMVLGALVGVLAGPWVGARLG